MSWRWIACWLVAASCGGAREGVPDGGEPDAPLPVDAAAIPDRQRPLDAALPPPDAPPSPDAPLPPDAAPLCTECLDHDELPGDELAEPLPYHDYLWTETMGLPGSVSNVVLAGDRLAFWTGAGVVIYDVAQRKRVEYVPIFEPPDPTTEVHIVGDASGRIIVFVGYRIWVYGPSNTAKRALALDGAERGIRGAPLLTPDGTVVYATQNDQLAARSLATGELRWRRDLGKDSYGYLATGFADYVVYVRTSPYRAQLFRLSSGEPMACGYAATSQGTTVAFPVAGGEIALDLVSDTHFYNFKVRALDRCHRTLWEWPAGEGTTAALVAPGPSILVVDSHADAPGDLTLLGPDGAVRATAKGSGWPLVAGADGRIYTAQCGTFSSQRIVGLAPDLTMEWSYWIRSCPEGAVLNDDGVLFVLWSTYDVDRSGPNITAIQTRSPGLARTSWPRPYYGDNRATRWAP